LIDPRTQFIQYCKNFPIDYFGIPRPLKSHYKSISDEDCAFMALSLLGVPHDSVINIDLEPKGWLIGPHLLDTTKYQDWPLAFCEEPLKTTLEISPWSLITDSVVQLAIAILRIKCDQGNPRESISAKQILENLGLTLFICDSAEKRRTDDLTLRYYSNHPDKLISSVRLYEYVIKKYWDPPYKRTEHNKRKEDIGKAFRLIFKKDMPNKLIIGERSNSPANVALAFIHHETEATYESISQIFYTEVNKISDSEIYHNLDQITDNKGDKTSYIKELKRLYTGK